MNTRKKQRLVEAKHLKRKETLLRNWDGEIQKRSESLLDSQPLWSYYGEISQVAREVGLQEEVYNTVLHFSHIATHGSSVGCRKYGVK